MGRNKKYGTARALQKAVDAYWNSISYKKPAVISTPTGYVDDGGRVQYATKLLTMNRDGSLNMDGTGMPKTVTEYLEAPSVAGLCLFLGVSRETWNAYAGDEELGQVCEGFRLRYEAYLVDRLETGKHIQGVIFNLEHNFGYKHRQIIGMDSPTRKALAASRMTMEEKRALLERASQDFAGLTNEKNG